jgi:(5-formylfuran-3-yl)methyl phosphate synthase
MTLFLASVRDPAEAELAVVAGADIIDLKDPDHGPLGALAPATIEACVTTIAGRAPLSATLGNFPLEGEEGRTAVLATAACGVDYVKLGIFPGPAAERRLKNLEADAERVRLVLIIFADALPDFDAVGLAARIGAHGVMFDTLAKDGSVLPDHRSYIDLAGHIASVKAEGLIVGLAGSLKARHVPSLLALEPDLLGFRGALCHGGDRRQALDPQRLAAIRAMIQPRAKVLRAPKAPDIAPHALC